MQKSSMQKPSMQKPSRGWLNGFIGVLIFSASLPATKLAVAGFDPVFLTSIRATIAAILATILLIIFRAKIPEAKDLLPLIIVSIGVVIGFPLLTALALQHITASYSTVFIGLLPLTTAIFGVFRAGEKTRAIFWVFSCLGGAMVAGFALTQGVDTSILGNFYMISAIIICGLGYAEGAKLARTLGGWQVISWALLLSLPAMAILSYVVLPDSFANIEQSAWIGLFYVSVFSMLIGFVFWYRGLAQGGIAAVSQLQLLQPFFGLMLAATLLNEPISWAMLVVTFGVVLCVAGAKHFAN